MSYQPKATQLLYSLLWYRSLLQRLCLFLKITKGGNRVNRKMLAEPRFLPTTGSSRRHGARYSLGKLLRFGEDRSSRRMCCWWARVMPKGLAWLIPLQSMAPPSLHANKPINKHSPTSRPYKPYKPTSSSSATSSLTPTSTISPGISSCLVANSPALILRTSFFVGASFAVRNTYLGLSHTLGIIRRWGWLLGRLSLNFQSYRPTSGNAHSCYSSFWYSRRHLSRFSINSRYTKSR